MFDLKIDGREIEKLALDLALTEKQVRYAMTRALARTTSALRRMSERGLKSELDVRKVSYLRLRLKSVKVRGTRAEGVRLWYGMNDMPVSALRGRLSSNTKGATFVGKAGAVSFPNGFVRKARSGSGPAILFRRGRERLPVDEGRVPVKDQMDSFVEGEIFEQVAAIFWKHFERDALARAKHGVGKGQ
ncbi:MAG: hypothetical protein DI569_12970 [Sphingopyxis macrogoltabida]|uniref:Uncharacterized protein n=1 Tax=Sphingopyxis macrogoltabida TaxID=33050 RepID=A0A2W5N4X7_SPHMC|nr:MAG: hypothetical protein DI569_12970 [Sphingopyxis macrogoltabida]